MPSCKKCFSGSFKDNSNAAHIPVIMTGGNKDAKAADRLPQEGKADPIGVGRAIMADSLRAKREVGTLQDR